jgi:uncharacterized protein (DUF1697 family)
MSKRKENDTILTTENDKKSKNINNESYKNAKDLIKSCEEINNIKENYDKSIVKEDDNENNKEDDNENNEEEGIEINEKDLDKYEKIVDSDYEIENNIDDEYYESFLTFAKDEKELEQLKDLNNLVKEDDEFIKYRMKIIETKEFEQYFLKEDFENIRKSITKEFDEKWKSISKTEKSIEFNLTIITLFIGDTTLKQDEYSIIKCSSENCSNKDKFIELNDEFWIDIKNMIKDQAEFSKESIVFILSKSEYQCC